MLILNSRNVLVTGLPLGKRSVVIRLQSDESPDANTTPNDALLWTSANRAFKGRLVCGFERDANQLSQHDGPSIVLPNEMDYLTAGDVLAVEVQRPAARILYRRNSMHNSFLLTERCNHYCLMCSQPPKDVADDWIVDELLEAIPLLSPETAEVGFTGGEPTLLGQRFLRLVTDMERHLPSTGLHILSNGRRFSDLAFTRDYASIRHHDAMLGIPIYSASSQTHDYIVQADGAFDETIRGILNLKTYGQQVEIRVVIHRQNYQHLRLLAEFIARNLTFVDHVALMALEMTGFAKANIDELWIDPFDYREPLYEAASLLDDFGLRTSIYNHQLCTIDDRIWHLARKSISDWKNEYRPECTKCNAQEHCGGFFATGRLRQSAHIKPINRYFGTT